MKLTKAMREHVLGTLTTRLYTEELAAMRTKEDNLFRDLAAALWGEKDWKLINDLLKRRPDCMKLRSNIEVQTSKKTYSVKSRIERPFPTNQAWTPTFGAEHGLSPKLIALVDEFGAERDTLVSQFGAARAEILAVVNGCTTTEKLYAALPQVQDLVKSHPYFNEEKPANIAVIVKPETLKALGFEPAAA